MSRTISGTISSLVTLSSAGDNPATIASGALLQAGLYGEGSTAWTVTNFGTIQNSGSLFALTLNSGGTLSNASAGVISASSGVEILGAAGTVTNAGSIAGSSVVGVSLADGGLVTNTGGISGKQEGVYFAPGGAGTVVNSGSISGSGSDSKGVRLTGGGLVSNQSGGTISGGLYGIWLTNNAATVVNVGAVVATGTGGIGVYAKHGGVVTNQSGGSIEGAKDGVSFVQVAGTLVNDGQIVSSGTGTAVALAVGGVVTNQSGGTIGGYQGVVLTSGTLINAGSINGTGTARQLAGVYAHSGYVSNQSGGTITGENAVYLDGTGGLSATLVNAGLIAGTFYGVNANYSGGDVTNLSGDTIVGGGGGIILVSGTVNNAGMVLGTTESGIDMYGGVATNQAGATISSGRWGFFGGGAGYGTATLLNSGLVIATATNGHGAELRAGGVISNQSTGTISGVAYGVVIKDTAGTLVNYGQIDASGTGTAVAGGTSISVAVFNQSGGTISGYQGVVLASGTVINAGSINSTGTAQHIAGVYVHSGLVSNQSGGTISGYDAVYLDGTGGLTATLVNAGLVAGAFRGVDTSYPGGRATNLSGGTITGGASGVYLKAGTVSNAGLILGGGGYPGVEMYGGLVTNQAGATISGGYWGFFGGGIGDGTSTLLNSGLVVATATNGQGAALVAGGVISNQSSGTINGVAYGVVVTDTAGTLVNYGQISASGTGTAVAGGTSISVAVYNQSGGTITGYEGVLLPDGTVNNAGVIYGSATGRYVGAVYVRSGLVTNQSGGTISGHYGVYLGGAGGLIGTLVNAGVITSTRWAVTTDYRPSQQVTNLSSGTIEGSRGGVYLLGSLDNAGLITGTAYGIKSPGLVVTNRGGGTISGYDGVALASGTVVNAGTIIGTTYALRFLPGDADLLVVDPSAVFSGTVSGGNSIGSSIVSTLELASGSTAGTLSGLGTQFIDFAQITIDSGAAWTLTAGAIGSGYTITDDGTLTNTGSLGSTVTLGGGAVLTNAATGTITAGAYGVVLGAPGSTLANAGLLAGSSGTGVEAASINVNVINQSGGTIIGSGQGIKAASSSINVTSQSGGTIIGSSQGVYLSGGDNLINAGLINATGIAGQGVKATSGGINVTNQSGGTIIGSGQGVYLLGGDSVANAGLIDATGTAGQGVDAARGLDIVSNASSGTIIGSAEGIYLYGGDTLTNAGLIRATGTAGQGVHTQPTGDAVTNASSGTIIAATGVYLASSTKLVNQGSIAGTQTGVYAGVAATVTNAGLISGGTYAVLFKPASFGERLIVDPGAVFSGTVSGGNSIGSSIVSTLELASGSSAGTLSGLGTQFIDFADITIDGSATWTLSGSNSLASGVTLTALGTLVDAGTLTNAGSLSSGVTLGSGAVLTNAATGTITGATGVYFNAAASLLNKGGITGTTWGVDANSLAVTVTNAGSISGGSYAVLFQPGHSNDRLIVDPGASFSGTVSGGNSIGSSIVSTLELASGSSHGTLSGLGTQFKDFASITIDSSASWTLSGTNSLASGISLINFGTLVDTGTLTNNGVIIADSTKLTLGGLIGAGTVTIGSGGRLTTTGTVASGQTVDFATSTGAFYLTPGSGNFAGVIDGLQSGDTIGLTGIADAESVTIASGNTLVVKKFTGANIDLRMDPAQNFTGTSFTVVDTGSNAVITVSDLPCFVAGTRLETADGTVAVEALRAGDLIRTAAGALRRVHWIGRRRLDPSRHPAPARAQPIRIVAGAIADGRPRRDLLVSPDHALFFDGMLVIARLLLNGATIRQESRRSVAYFHVELDTHDILLAEGLPVESYLDTGNRNMFENASLPIALHPEFGGNDQARRVAESCAPLVDDPVVVEPIWRRLAARATALGWTLPPPPLTTDEPALCVAWNGRVIAPTVVSGGRYSFVLPATGTAVRLRSRHVVPSLLRPWIEDSRRLGVMVRRLTLRSATEVGTLPLDHPGLQNGWWAVERDDQTMWRWTDGDAELPLPGDGDVAVLDIEFAGAQHYPVVEATEWHPSFPRKREPRAALGSRQPQAARRSN